jgi:hypothetical protein
MSLEVFLVGIHKTIQPWEKLLGTMVGVQNNGDAVRWSDRSDVVGSGDTTSDGCLLFAVGNTLSACQNWFSYVILKYVYLSCEVSSTTLGHLKDNRSLCIAGSLERSNDGRGRRAVLLLFCQISVL